MADNNDTPPPPPKKKRGRPVGTKLYKPVLERDGKHRYSQSISTLIRQKVDPDTLWQFMWSIAQGIKPVAVEEAPGNGQWRIIPDPNPNATSPTLEQQITAIKWLVDRRDGLAPQKIDFNATLTAELPDAMLTGLLENPLALVKLREVFLLQAPGPESPEENVEDAEIVDSEAELVNDESPPVED